VSKLQPEAERRRLVAVADYAGLAPGQAGLASAAQIVAHFLDVPVCAVGLIDGGRIRVVAGVGITDDELPAGWGLTPLLLAGDEVLVVPDTSAERAFVQHAVLPVGAWAAAPLQTTDGAVIGAIFVADRKPRAFNANQVAVLDGMGRLLMTELEVRRQRHHNGSATVLKDVERHFESLLRDASDTVAVLDADGTVSYCSPGLQRLLGYDETEPALSVSRLVHPDDMPLIVGSITVALVRSGVTGPVEFRLADGSGNWRTMEAVFSNNFDDPTVAGVVLYLRDITNRHRRSSLLSAEARVLEHIARAAPLEKVLNAVVALVELHAPGARAVVRALDARQRTLSIAAAPNLPQTFVDAVRDWRLDMDNACSAVRSKPPVVISDVAAADDVAPAFRNAMLGHRLKAAWAMPVVSSVTGRMLGSVGVFLAETRAPDEEDVHLLRVAAGLVGLAFERLGEAVEVDEWAATGVVPRTELVRRLDAALARSTEAGGKVAVLLLDLDRFKEVNEGFGHEGGDMVLPLVTRRLADVVRPTDLVARVAGDEFVVVCEGLVGELEAVGVAERINIALREPVAIQRSEVRLTASIGIAMTHGVGDHAEALLRDADAALYQAKQRGRARFELFNESRRREAKDRRELEGELERALDTGELRVWFQPEMELPSGRLLGFEALVRWQHPERGLLSPAEFIPQAERSGLIDRLGAWVLDEACRFARKWQDARDGSQSFMVAVNLSVRQLTDPLLAERVGEALADSGLPADELCLEITESALMDDADLSLGALRALKALGVRLAIDDFGTGYSSLAYLRRFPIDSVKIDRTFVSGLGSRVEDGAIVSAVLDLTRALGLSAIAEGVEKTGQRDELVRLGCGAAQGYLFSPPRPADEVFRL
jgi:diguanylate cyclase (GGDEF)-like protein/PAS domain S-box-containing protein